MLIRLVRFNLVSALGMIVQLGAAALLVGAIGLDYLAGSALAIELAVLHNFAWHDRWTWRDPGRRRGAAGRRCLAFHAGNGCVSMLGSLVLLPWLVGVLHIHFLAANLVAIAVTGLANFLVGDRLVFRGKR